MSARAILPGMIAGTALTLVLMLLSISGTGLSTKPLGIHAGIWGLLLNVLVVGAAHLQVRKSS